MVKKGRPVKITQSIVASRCLELYWKKGIKNVTYNSAIKYSECSKGTIYSLFRNEDELHLKTLEYYYNNNMKRIVNESLIKNDVYEFIDLYFKFTKSSYCYFIISNSNKNLLGKLSKKYLIKLEKKILQLLSNLIVRHINKHKLNPKKLNINSLSSYLLHNITLINIMKNNKTKNTDLLIIKEAMKEKVLMSLQ